MMDHLSLSRSLTLSALYAYTLIPYEVKCDSLVPACFQDIDVSFRIGG